MLLSGQTREAEAYREQLESLGHVYVPDVYSPELAEGLGAELDGLFAYERLRPGVMGEQLRNSETVTPDDRHPRLLAVLGAIGTLTSDIFKKQLWPVQPQTHSLLQMIDMTPIVSSRISGREEQHSRVIPVAGVWHRDRPDIKGLVAISTYEGESSLEVDGVEPYKLSPGGVMYMDNDFSLLHRGISNVRRRALGVANIAGKKTGRAR